MFKYKNQVPNLLTQLSFVAVMMLLVMTLFEWLKQFFIPEISIWGSHFITIIFTTLLAIVISYFILKQFHREYIKRLEEIGQRKASQKALKNSEKTFQRLVENAKVGVYQVAPDGHFIMLNDKLAHIFGYENSTELLEQVGNITQLYVRPEERAIVLDQLNSGGFIDRIELELKNRCNEPIWVLFSARTLHEPSGDMAYEGFMVDITGKKRIEAEKDQLIEDLEESMSQVKLLSGLLPICASCKKIRDDKGYWNQIEEYIGSHSEVQFSHGCCPDCFKKLYPEYVNRRTK